MFNNIKFHKILLSQMYNKPCDERFGILGMAHLLEGFCIIHPLANKKLSLTLKTTF